ncbi:DUF4396 domain-containing protein [Blastococcus deserti]|uniref:DUF4396 domain-containing protein n=1 Tax=Blastococcus deserti TaxID=2259033 RepID=A0ABW4XCP1_9ACTN
MSRWDLDRLPVRATLSCLTGCAIGKVLGTVTGAALGWSHTATVVWAAAVAFVLGCWLTMVAVLQSGLPVRPARAWPSRRARCRSDMGTREFT